MSRHDIKDMMSMEFSVVPWLLIAVSVPQNIRLHSFPKIYDVRTPEKSRTHVSISFSFFSNVHGVVTWTKTRCFQNRIFWSMCDELSVWSAQVNLEPTQIIKHWRLLVKSVGSNYFWMKLSYRKILKFSENFDDDNTTTLLLTSCKFGLEKKTLLRLFLI